MEIKIGGVTGMTPNRNIGDTGSKGGGLYLSSTNMSDKDYLLSLMAGGAELYTSGGLLDKWSYSIKSISNPHISATARQNTYDKRWDGLLTENKKIDLDHPGNSYQFVDIKVITNLTKKEMENVRVEAVFSSSTLKVEAMKSCIPDIYRQGAGLNIIGKYQAYKGVDNSTEAPGDFTIKMNPEEGSGGVYTCGTNVLVEHIKNKNMAVYAYYTISNNLERKIFMGSLRFSGEEIPYLSISPSVLSFYQPESGSQVSKTISVDSSGPYLVYKTASWITTKSDVDTITVSVEDLRGGEPREGTITVVLDGHEDITASCRIKQNNKITIAFEDGSNTGHAFYSGNMGIMGRYIAFDTNAEELVAKSVTYSPVGGSDWVKWGQNETSTSIISARSSVALSNNANIYFETLADENQGVLNSYTVPDPSSYQGVSSVRCRWCEIKLSDGEESENTVTFTIYQFPYCNVVIRNREKEYNKSQEYFDVLSWDVTNLEMVHSQEPCNTWLNVRYDAAEPTEKLYFRNRGNDIFGKIMQLQDTPLSYSIQLNSTTSVLVGNFLITCDLLDIENKYGAYIYEDDVLKVKQLSPYSEESRVSSITHKFTGIDGVRQTSNEHFEGKTYELPYNQSFTTKYDVQVISNYHNGIIFDTNGSVSGFSQITLGGKNYNVIPSTNNVYSNTELVSGENITFRRNAVADEETYSLNIYSADAVLGMLGSFTLSYKMKYVNVVIALCGINDMLSKLPKYDAEVGGNPNDRLFLYLTMSSNLYILDDANAWRPGIKENIFTFGRYYTEGKGRIWHYMISGIEEGAIEDWTYTKMKEELAKEYECDFDTGFYAPLGVMPENLGGVVIESFVVPQYAPLKSYYNITTMTEQLFAPSGYSTSSGAAITYPYGRMDIYSMPAIRTTDRNILIMAKYNY